MAPDSLCPTKAAVPRKGFGVRLPMCGILSSSVDLWQEESWIHPESPYTDAEMNPQNQRPFSENRYLLETPG